MSHWRQTNRRSVGADHFAGSLPRAGAGRELSPSDNAIAFLWAVAVLGAGPLSFAIGVLLFLY